MQDPENIVRLVDFKQIAAHRNMCKLTTDYKRANSKGTVENSPAWLAIHRCTQFFEIVWYYNYMASGIQAS